MGLSVFYFKDIRPTDPYHLSLHDALPISPPKPINQNSPRQILRHPHASPKCRRESTPEALGCFGTTDRVGERPRSSGQTTAWPRARRGGQKGVTGGLGCFGTTDRVGERPRSSGQTTAWPRARRG